MRIGVCVTLQCDGGSDGTTSEVNLNETMKKCVVAQLKSACYYTSSICIIISSFNTRVCGCMHIPHRTVHLFISAKIHHHSKHMPHAYGCIDDCITSIYCMERNMPETQIEHATKCEKKHTRVWERGGEDRDRERKKEINKQRLERHTCDNYQVLRCILNILLCVLLLSCCQ